MAQAKPEMTWLILIVATTIVSFYLRFLWEMHKELKLRQRKRQTRRTWPPVVRRNLFRVDPGDLWVDKSDRDSSQIKDNL